ncbi:Calmodulin binding protein PICBP [Linum perenne]
MNPDNKVQSGNATDSDFSLNSDSLSVTSPSSSSSSAASHKPTSSPNYMRTTTSSVAKKSIDSQRSGGGGGGGSSINPAKGLSRVSSSKFRMRRSFRRRPDSSWKMVDNPASDHDSSSSDSEGRSGDAESEHTTFAARRTTSSSRPGRSLTKVASLRIKTQAGSSVVRSTCSSALRDSKLATKNEQVNKVCPYSYCSLHGHHHSNDQVQPTLKRFVSMRRRMLKPQKKKTNSSSDKGSGGVSYSKKNQTKKSVVVSEGAGKAANGGRQNGSDVVKTNGGSLETDDNSNVDKDLVVSPSADDVGVVNLSSEKSMEKNKKNVGLWGLIYQHMASGIAAEGDEEKTGEEEEEAEKDRREDSEEGNGGSGNLDSQKLDAIKLVQEAFDKILSEIPDPLSDNQSVDYSEAGSDELQIAPTSDESGETFNDSVERKKEEPAKKRVNGWSNLKKIMLMKRFVKAMDNVKNFNLRKHREDNQQEGGVDTEKVSLRPQTIGEKKNSEEWMLDYALQKVISTLAPAQKRKVALIVQAFETVAPQGETGSHMNSSADSTPETPVQKAPEQEENIRFGIVLRKVSKVPKESPESRDGTEIRDHHGFDGVKVRDDDSGLTRKEMKSSDQINAVADAHQEEPIVVEKSVDNNTLAPAAREEETMMKIEDTRPSTEAESDELGGDRNAAEPEAKMGKHKNTNLWFLIYKHMVSGTTQPLQEGSEEDGGRHESRSQIEAIRLVEEAIDEIPLPETQDDASPAAANDDRSSVTRDINFQVEDKHVDENQRESNNSRTGSKTTEQQGEEQKEQAKPPLKKSWSNLKKVILLKRFIKSMEKVNDSCLTSSTTKFINPKEPKFLPSNNGKEAEKVQLRRQDAGDRKSGDEWMLDHALRQVVAQLTPVRRRKVELLVEAFETVIPTIGT